MEDATADEEAKGAEAVGAPVGGAVATAVVGAAGVVAVAVAVAGAAGVGMGVVVAPRLGTSTTAAVISMPAKRTPAATNATRPTRIGGGSGGAVHARCALADCAWGCKRGPDGVNDWGGAAGGGAGVPGVWEKGGGGAGVDIIPAASAGIDAAGGRIGNDAAKFARMRSTSRRQSREANGRSAVASSATFWNR